MAGVTGRPRPLLFDAYPDLARAVRWMSLADVPTAVEPCDASAEYLGRRDVYMKRDDLVSPRYGGNKVRRFEFLLPQILARHTQNLVTVGGLASTQVMATTVFGRAQGLDVHAVLFDQPLTAFAREQVLGFLSEGAHLAYGGSYLRTALRAWRMRRRLPHSAFLWPGASGPLANLGYVDGMLELAAQVAGGQAPRPDVVVVPTGSSGTLAALALTAAQLGWDTEVVGVRIAPAYAVNRLTVGRVIAATDRFLARRDHRWKPVASRVRYRLFGDALGGGYGHPTPDAERGAEQVEALTGAPREITYSGKAMAGLRQLVSEPANRGKTFLLWNTLSAVRPAIRKTPDDVPADLRWMWERDVVG